MDPVNPWLDPSEVRHLAEQLLRPIAPAKISAADPGFDSSFVGFMKPDDQRESVDRPVRQDGSNVEATYPQAEEIQEVTEGDNNRGIPSHPRYPDKHHHQDVAQAASETEAPRIPAEPAASNPEPPPNPSTQTRFLERIQIFRDWLAKNFNATDIFILDRDGKVIFDESGHGRLHFMARNLALASRGSGNIHVKIGPAAILEVVPCETPYGRIILGTLVPEALPSDHMQTITEVLRQTASPA